MARLLDNQAISRRLRLAMERRGLTQVALARSLGVCQSAVAHYVTRAVPRRHLSTLAGLLDVPVEWLTTGFPRQEWEAAVVPVGADHTPATGVRVAVPGPAGEGI